MPWRAVDDATIGVTMRSVAREQKSPQEILKQGRKKRTLANATPTERAEFAARASREYSLVQLDPEFVEIKKTLTIPEIIEAVKTWQKKPKGQAGRFPIPNKLAVLDAAALAKVCAGRYSQIAADWNLKPTQLIDLVRHNREEFDRKVHAIRRKLRTKA